MAVAVCAVVMICSLTVRRKTISRLMGERRAQAIRAAGHTPISPAGANLHKRSAEGSGLNVGGLAPHAEQEEAVVGSST